MNPRILLIALPLAGCAPIDGNFPSLAPRPIESRSDAAATPPEPIPQPVDPAVAGQVADLLAQLRAGDAAFAELQPDAVQAAEAARDATVGNEAWVAAQQLLSALEATRGPTMRALGALDSLLVAELAEGDATETLRSAQAEAARVAGEQQARVDAIRGMLAR